jgi:hypothetical protein
MGASILLGVSGDPTQLTGKPAYRVWTLEGVRAFAIQALKRAWTAAARRQRESEMSPAIGASRSLRLSHGMILPPVRNLVNSKNGMAWLVFQKFKLGHYCFQTRSIRGRTRSARNSR